MRSYNTELYSGEIEAAVISTIIFENENRDEILSLIDDEDMFIPSNKEVLKIIKKLHDEGMPIDESFILPELSKKIKNAEIVMIDIMAANPISSIHPYIDQLKSFRQKRDLASLSTEIQKMISDDKKPIDIVMSVGSFLQSIESKIDSGVKTRRIADIIRDIEDDMEKARSGEKQPFYETGYTNFDSYAGGFVENGLTVIAARPSMGKSSFMSGPIVNGLSKGDSVLLYSMEVIDKNALLRLISFRSQEYLSMLKVGILKNYEAYKEAKDFFTSKDSKFQIVDKSGMTRKDLEIDIKKRIKEDPNIKLVLIDHLLQIEIDSSRHAPTELGNITKMLKRISQDNKISIILLSQLNRAVESRENRRPMMSDLQGSGSIEQDADMIVFLYRPEYYKEKEWDSEKNGEYSRPEIEHAEVIIGKNRDGPTGSVEIKFKSKTASFLNDTTPVDEVYYIDDEDEDIEAYSKFDNDTIDMPTI